MTHLHTIELRLSNTKRRAANCKPHQVVFWALEISQIEKELAGEYTFLGITPPAPCELTEDQLLAELLA